MTHHTQDQILISLNLLAMRKWEKSGKIRYYAHSEIVKYFARKWIEEKMGKSFKKQDSDEIYYNLDGVEINQKDVKGYYETLCEIKLYYCMEKKKFVSSGHKKFANHMKKLHENEIGNERPPLWAHFSPSGWDGSVEYSNKHAYRGFWQN
jgi:hypothetical protein